MILHHYSISPYAEKIRLMLGYTGIAWQSAISPPMPPRPIVDPLVGGYRRIPIAQIGADMFCDTRIIAGEIARLSERPELAFDNNTNTHATAFASRVNDQVFMPVVSSAQPTTLLKNLITKYWPWQIARLIRDRAKVGKTANLPRMRSSQRRELIDDFKLELENKLTQSPFLYGEQASIADFAAYHIVWFANQTQAGDFLADFKHAKEWQRRMHAFGNAEKTKVSKAFVFETAKNNEPRDIDKTIQTHELIGKKVTIQPSDYAQDASSGVLVGADHERWIIQRQTKRFGQLNIHFPLHGYAIAAQ